MASRDPLEVLVVDESELARATLAEALHPFVRLTKTGGLLPQPEFDGLSAEMRVATVLLALKAGFLLGLRDRQGATPTEIVAVSGMPGGTVRPKLSALKRERLVVVDGSDYLLAPHAIERVARQLANPSAGGEVSRRPSRRRGQGR